MTQKGIRRRLFGDPSVPFVEKQKQGWEFAQQTRMLAIGLPLAIWVPVWLGLFGGDGSLSWWECLIGGGGAFASVGLGFLIKNLYRTRKEREQG